MAQSPSALIWLYKFRRTLGYQPHKHHRSFEDSLPARLPPSCVDRPHIAPALTAPSILQQKTIHSELCLQGCPCSTDQTTVNSEQRRRIHIRHIRYEKARLCPWRRGIIAGRDALPVGGLRGEGARWTLLRDGESSMLRLWSRSMDRQDDSREERDADCLDGSLQGNRPFGRPPLPLAACC